MLEQSYEKFGSSFVTLTYNEIHHPQDGSLQPDDLRSFLKHLRERTGVGSFRYFAVGEYGDRSWRPHYHLALFGVPPTFENAIAKSWSVRTGEGHERELRGFIKVDFLTHERAGYIAGYCTKKLTNAKDTSLNGRHPEFFRCSKFPPLGAAFYAHYRDLLFTDKGARIVAAAQGIPRRYKFGGRTFPHGKYWQKWLVDQTGIPMSSCEDFEYLLPDDLQDEQEIQRQKAHDQQRRRLKRRSRAL